MVRRLILAAFAIAVSALSGNAGAAAPKRPNIVFILADDKCG